MLERNCKVNDPERLWKYGTTFRCIAFDERSTTRILDGDDGLAREQLRQFERAVIEGVNSGAIDGEGANQTVAR